MKKIIIIVTAALLLTSMVILGINQFRQSSQPPVKEPIADQLNFYSGDLNQDTREAITDWFVRKGIDTSTDNFVIRQGSYKKDYVDDINSTLKRIEFYVDLKKPNTSYKVFKQMSLMSGIEYAPMYITCPDVNNQHGDASKCEGMTQL